MPVLSMRKRNFVHIFFFFLLANTAGVRYNEKGKPTKYEGFFTFLHSEREVFIYAGKNTF